ncbi:hypothetical protein VINI7043_03023 [Vibrio nigripulchritudo ATCC 27043]|uniref:DUF2987 domain-containing protein n=1 Tax=Vibrio nigripulchritudo TaxID=28173 RepID=U4K5B0_9VIBR|nr:DUF2987 domain-containing protein [Vibrio nigripulchritudo]EGU60727.1 hypothetical protein VINI7043_03023 [Vibrio nigripulchritudo ATCC 27043]CCN34412.1 conserved hypothetical protein [Vibrio nigripulchritudo AM115]CCN43330.1 conserved hypothetical protein [Vibrio nigripulchritudo FTn2]CCN63712.1 conserved hypothetical protein [Vibrio nigripulchritudo POn4]CCN77037.1 conserved hypothetical protein [Vibrio nigripulchritudo SO65]
MKIQSLLALTVSLGLALPIQAQEYMFTYSKLYTQMKNNAKEGHDDVKVGLFFIDADTKKLCKLEKAWMEKEEHYEEFDTSGFELKVPVDKNLKSANPLVFVRTEKDKRCDFSMVVMAKEQFSGTVQYGDVEKLLPQMQVMLEDLGGMFASWFTPDVEGVTLEFANELNSEIKLSNGKTIDVVDGRAYLALNQITENGSFTLPEATTRVLPYLPKAN